MSFRKKGRKEKSGTLRFRISKNNYLKITGFAILTLLCLLNLKTAFLEQLAYSGVKAAAGLAQHQTNPKALYSLGYKEYLVNNDTEDALHFFTKAISNLSLYIPAFIRIGEIGAEQGNIERAQEISNYVDSIAPDTFQWRWDRTMLAYSLDQNELLAKNLAWFIKNSWGKRAEALTVATSVWRDPYELIEKVGIQNTSHILHFYIKQQELEKSEIIWDVIVQNDLIEETNTLWYTNYLINNNEIKSALQVWNRTDASRNENSLITNRDFKTELTGSGFGWRLNKKHKKLLNPKNGKLQITFQGNENVIFNLHQLIPVNAGESYNLSLLQKSKNLSTDQRLHWIVSGYQCDDFYERTEMIESSTDWQKAVISFSVPETCNAIWLSLRRNKSYHFDNKISGSFTAKDLKLTPLPNTFSAIMQ